MQIIAYWNPLRCLLLLLRLSLKLITTSNWSEQNYMWTKGRGKIIHLFVAMWRYHLITLAINTSLIESHCNVDELVDKVDSLLLSCNENQTVKAKHRAPSSVQLWVFEWAIEHSRSKRASKYAHLMSDPYLISTDLDLNSILSNKNLIYKYIFSRFTAHKQARAQFPSSQLKSRNDCSDFHLNESLTTAPKLCQ